MLRFLALEGSATYLINAHRNMDEARRKRSECQLIQGSEAILTSVRDANTTFG